MHASMPRRCRFAFIVCLLLVPTFASAQRKFENLKVLPKTIPEEELDGIMNGFTRALGVRCAYCHVGQEGKTMRGQDFKLDDKVTKLKARTMIQMVQDINDKYLVKLDHRADPAVHVQCVTCHHGVPVPRTLQETLTQAYDSGGVDTLVSRYQSLRERYYGRFTYDFGDVPLSDVASHVLQVGHVADAARLHALNVDMNPKSAFAKRRSATASLRLVFGTAGVDSGTAAYTRFKGQYGPMVMVEDVLNQVGYGLLFENRVEPALGAFKLNVAEHPESGNAFDSLGEALAKHGDKQQAIEAYEKSIQLDPNNDNAKHHLDELKGNAKASPGGK